MSRDWQNPYGDDASGRRSGEHGAQSGGRPAVGRGGASGGMSGQRSSISRGGNTPPGGRGGGGGGGGLIRPPLSGAGGDDDRASRPRSGAMGTPGRFSAGPGGPSGAQRSLGRSRPGSDDDRGSGRSGAMRGTTAPGGRSMGDRFRDAGRSMSRQFSAMMEGAGRAMRQEMSNAGRSLTGPAPAMVTGDAPGSSYRRSRGRVLLRKWRQRRARANPMTFAIGFIVAVVVASVVIGGGGAGSVYAYQYYQSKRGAIQAAAAAGDAQSTRIFDRNGTLLYAMPRRQGYQFSIRWGQFGNTIVNATLDTEDHTFWDNNGVDLYATVRAVVTDLSHGGAADQGASTITQQLVKNLVLNNPEKTYDRKIHEAILSIGITKKNGLDPNGFEKWKILEMYLNNIYYGDQNYGVESAARNYFGLVPTPTQTATQQLDLAQAAILVRIPNEPSRFAPFANGYQWSCATTPCDQSKWANGAGNEENVYGGALTVLYNMLQYGDISQGEYDRAKQEVISILENQQIYHWKFIRNGTSNSEQIDKKAPHFVDYVIKELIHDFGMSDQDTVAQAGFAVYTTLDYNLEKVIEEDAYNEVNKPFTRHWYCDPYYHNSCQVPALKDSDNVHNMAAVAIDPHTGDILAMMGSVDYGSTDPHVLGYLNMATTPRSMGSSTKPLVYATAFQMGWYPGIMLQDIPVCFPGQQPPPPDAPPNWKPTPDPAAPACAGYYVPHNYDATSFSGTAPIRVMLANSLNIPATEAMDFVGASYDVSSRFISMVGRMGISTCIDCDNMVSSRRLGPTTALGTQEIPLIELTSAYGTFPAQGKHVPPRAILRIDNANGDTVWTAPIPKGGQAMSPQTAYMMTSILTDNTARAGDFKVENPLCFTCYPDYLDFGDKATNGYQDVAAKTGTAQGDGGPTEVVTIGYSPYMTLGVWAGNTKNKDWLGANIIGITGAGYVFHDAMAWAIKNYKWPNTPFPIPSGMTRAQFNCNTGLAPYKGTDPNTFANAGPDTPGNGWCRLANNNSTDLYDGYLTGRKYPDRDWILDGQFPDVS
jgi:membrane peptidoglycan carboxypeptidase